MNYYKQLLALMRMALFSGSRIRHAPATLFYRIGACIERHSGKFLYPSLLIAVLLSAGLLQITTSKRLRQGYL